MICYIHPRCSQQYHILTPSLYKRPSWYSLAQVRPETVWSIMTSSWCRPSLSHVSGVSPGRDWLWLCDCVMILSCSRKPELLLLLYTMIIKKTKCFWRNQSLYVRDISSFEDLPVGVTFSDRNNCIKMGQGFTLQTGMLSLIISQ